MGCNVVECHIRNYFNYPLTVCYQKTCPLDLYTWGINFCCPWNCCYDVTFHFIHRVPDGFILFKILGGLVFLLMGALALWSVIKSEYRQEIFVCGRLFQVAAQIIKENYWLLGLILVWLFLECCLIALISFQMLSAWSIGPLIFDPESPFLRVSAFISNFLSFFIFVEFIWGLAFLKEAFNFVVGGYATLWYCYRNEDKSKIRIWTPFKRLIRYHWGSVAGGSLLLWLFYFIDLFVDFFFVTLTLIIVI